MAVAAPEVSKLARIFFEIEYLSVFRITVDRQLVAFLHECAHMHRRGVVAILDDGVVSRRFGFSAPGVELVDALHDPGHGNVAGGEKRRCIIDQALNGGLDFTGGDLAGPSLLAHQVHAADEQSHAQIKVDA
jgi:hypothetical protein